MKVVLLLLIFILTPNLRAESLPEGIPRVRWSPNPLYSEEGFRLGVILQFSSHWFWHYEGELMMGFDSTPMTIMDHDCLERETAAAQSLANENRKQYALKAVAKDCIIGKNPWQFSSVDPQLYERFNKASVTPVVIYYTRAVTDAAGAIKLPSLRAVFAGTDNFVTKIWPVNPDFNAPASFAIGQGEAPSEDMVGLTSGTLQGHIIKATMDHLLFKTYEITVQESKGGSSFTRLSIDDKDLFDHVVMMMLTGKQLKIDYKQLFNIEGSWLSALRGYSTNFRVMRVQISEEQSPMKDNF